MKRSSHPKSYRRATALISCSLALSLSAPVFADGTMGSGGLNNFNSMNGSGDGSSGIGSSQGGGDLNNYSEALSIKDEAIKSMLLQRIVEAQSALMDAQRQTEWQKAAYWQTLNDAARYELNRVIGETAQHDRIRADISNKAALIRPLHDGQSNAAVLWALNYFMAHYIPAYVVKETMSARVDALPATNFIANDRHSTVQDFPGGDVGALMEFLETNRLSTKRWSPAHYQLLTMMTAFSTAAEERIKAMRAYLDGVRKGIINVWTTPPPK